MSDYASTDSEKTETDSEEEIEAEDSNVFEISSVNHDTISNLNKQRQENHEMCDVILQVDDTEFPAHRLVLSASSDYFFKMFTIDMQEKHNKKVVIKSVTSNAMSEILNSIYTNKISFSKQNISDILHGASLMQYPGIVVAAARYIEQNIDMQNCFWFRELALAHPFEILKETVIDFLLVHVEEASTYSEFLEFTFDELTKIFSSNDLFVESEKSVFEMLVKWLNNNVEDRKEDFAALFKHVRLQFVPIDHIIEVIRNNEIVMQFDDSRRLVENALVHHIKPSVLPDQVLRKCFIADSIMFVSFGNNNQTVQGFYDLQNSSWRMKPVTFKLTDSCCVASKHPVSVFCGVGESNKEVIQFKGYRWMELPSMNEIRYGAAAVFFNETLFVFGGEKRLIPIQNKNSHNYSKIFCGNFEKFDDNWQLQEQNCSELSRSYFSAQSVGSKIYLIGGYKCVSRYYKEVCSDTISFCPSKNKWKSLPNLHQGRVSFGSAVLGSKIYVFGGIDINETKLSTVEVFDVSEKRWTGGGSIQPGPTQACNISNRIYFWDLRCEHLWQYKNSKYTSEFCCIELIKRACTKGALLPFSVRCLNFCFGRNFKKFSLTPAIEYAQGTLCQGLIRNFEDY